MVFEPLLADYSWFLCDFLSLFHKLRKFVNYYRHLCGAGKLP